MPYDAKDGGVYLVYVDDSREFQCALNLACDLAGRYDGYVMLVKALEPLDFQQWGAVEEKLIAEQRHEAESVLAEASEQVTALNGKRPSVYLAEGHIEDVITHAVECDQRINAVVLGVSADGSNPLATHFTAKGFANLNVPLFLVPGHSEETL